jgi:hypothetical protein
VLVGHWYEHRELADASGAAPVGLPPMVRDLIDPYRVRRL